MKKKLLGTVIVLGTIACAAAFLIMSKTEIFASKVDPSTEEAKNAAVPQEIQVIHYRLDRDRSYSSLEELKNDAKFIVVADLVEKKPSRMEGQMVETHNEFFVKKVFKGPQELENTNITVNETGGIYEGKKYTAEGDELFDAGEYLLFLDKGDKYFVDGITAGKFKLNDSPIHQDKFDVDADYLKKKFKTFGQDKVRIEVENLYGQELLGKLK